MNPIEHMWDIIGRRVRKRSPAPDTIENLKRALTEEWEAVSECDV